MPSTMEAGRMDDIREKLSPLFEGMMKALYKQEGASFSVDILASDEAQAFIGTHASVLDSTFEKTPMSDIMRQRLQRSDYIFSGMKTFHELNEAFPSLLDENGNRKPFEQFLKDVQSIDNTYNKNYLRAEYNFVQSSAEMAAKWEGFMEDGDRYNLQYRTAGDDKVRPEHAALNGVTLPPSDSFWSEFYPPNGWNCRCTVVQVRKSKFPTTEHEEAMARGEDALQRDTKGIFRFNPGKEEKAVPDYNPYTIRRCRDCDQTKMKLARFVPDNELCDACKKIRSLCDKQDSNDLTSKLRDAINAKGHERNSILREIVSSRRLKPVKGHDGVYSSISDKDTDYDRLVSCADKAVKHGYNVALLPNPKLLRTPDFILYNKKYIATYDVKTIIGNNSVSNRFEESIGQTDRVILNLSNTYNPRSLAVDVHRYFEGCKEAKEVIIFKRGKMIKLRRNDVLMDKAFIIRFMRRYNK